MVERLFNECIGTRSSDGGGEFVSQQFIYYLSEVGISHQVSYTPQQNGRKHHHITETATALSMMIYAHIPRFLWTEAFHTAVHIINQLPTDVAELRMKLLMGTLFRFIISVGCTAYVHTPAARREKFGCRMCIYGL